MLTSLRVLLVTFVAVAPLMVGLQAATADGVATSRISGSGSAPRDGSREDDAGTLLEESGENEAEQDEIRLEHSWTAPSRDSAIDAPGRFSASVDRPVRSCCRTTAALSRGPPAHR